MDLEERLNRLQTVPDDLVNAMSKVEQDAMKRVLAIMDQLDVVDGNITNSSKNLSLIKSIDEDLRTALFNNSYYKAVNGFGKEFSIQAEATNDYFASIVEGFEVIGKYNTVLQTSRNSALSLLSEDVFTQTLIKPIQDALLSAATGNGSFSATLKTLRQAIQGNGEIDGRLLSHVKRIAYDSFAIANRQYTQTIATNLKFEWYQYVGGVISDSRCFCIERHGKYFHIEEIKEWGRGNLIGKCGEYNKSLSRTGWQGMNVGTNEVTIMSYVGGYQCKHDLLPVAKRSVPKIVVDEAIEKGWHQAA